MEICPDYQFEDPHMFIIIKSNGLATKMIVANWDRANELGNSKREWFGKFGTLVCDEGLLCNYLEMLALYAGYMVHVAHNQFHIDGRHHS